MDGDKQLPKLGLNLYKLDHCKQISVFFSQNTNIISQQTALENIAYKISVLVRPQHFSWPISYQLLDLYGRDKDHSTETRYYDCISSQVVDNVTEFRHSLRNDEPVFIYKFLALLVIVAVGIAQQASIMSSSDVIGFPTGTVLCSTVIILLH